MTEELKDYSDRHKFWMQISLEQLSTTNNLLLTISTGFLAFCFDKQSIKSIITDSTLSYNWSLLYYFASLGLIALSITLGIAVLFCRLYNFRISRHLVLTRKRVFKQYKGEILIDNDLKDVNIFRRISTIFTIIFIELPFIDKTIINDYFKDEKLKEKFNDLRQISKVLGSASWLWTKIQVLLFFSSVICYVLHFWML